MKYNELSGWLPRVGYIYKALGTGTGNAPLKENGLLVSDSKSKARILNHQYQSVFSKEDSADIPQPSEPESPTMPEIVVTEEGVFK